MPQSASERGILIYIQCNSKASKLTVALPIYSFNCRLRIRKKVEVMLPLNFDQDKDLPSFKRQEFAFHHHFNAVAGRVFNFADIHGKINGAHDAIAKLFIDDSF